MKTKFKTVLLLSLLLFICAGCSKKDVNEPSNNSSTITTSGVIIGTVENYTSDVIESIKWYDNGNILGTSSISSTGKFSLTLSDPTLLYMLDTSDFDVNNVIISDTTVRGGAGGEERKIPAYKNNVEVGYILKCNLSSDNKTAGNTWCTFMYVNKPVTIKGTGSYTDDGETYTYNITCVKGWNEYAYIEESNNSYTITTTIPSGLEWYYFPSGSSSVKQQKSQKNTLFRHFVL